jgi:Mn-dependent DtxR family transcriptional regulator
MLQKPEAPWTQSTLVSALHMDPATVRTALRHLQGSGLIEVFTPAAVGPLRAITFRGDTALGAALLRFHQSLRDFTSEPSQ